MSLPAEFAWLAKATEPLMIVEAMKLYGTVEVPGNDDSPVIMGWARETGLDKAGYSGDDVPWCGLFMAVVARRASKPIVNMPLRALSWASFGLQSPAPSLGDVLVYKRTGGGHVGLYVGEDATNHYCLGGNQSDQVNIIKKPKVSLHACRRPVYHNMPKSVRPVFITGQVADVQSNASEA